MVTDAFLSLLDPIVAWIASVLDNIPDFGTVAWIVTGVGTLNQLVNLDLALSLVATTTALLLTVMGVRLARVVISYLTAGGGVA